MLKPVDLFHIKLPDFEGPLDLLLYLIEREELDITKVSLAMVTGTYLEYIHLLDKLQVDQIADFLVIAAKLLLLKSQAPWWYVGLAGFMIAELAAPLASVREVVLPIVSFWPALVWSALGHRERQNATGGVMFSCPRPIARLLPAAWLAGALIMVAAGAPALVRLSLANEFVPVLGWLLGAAFVSGLAFASGAWTGSAKFFEVGYLFLWYVGPMHKVAELDYTGVTTARSPLLWFAYGGAAAVLLVLGWSGRARQLRA